MDEAIAKLSPKERQVLELLLEGLSPEQVGQQLQLSPYAVRTFARNAGEKLSQIPE